MSQDHHHEPSLDHMLFSQVGRLVETHLNNSQHSDKVKSEIFEELGQALLQLSSSHNTRLDVSKFIIKPAKLSDGSCVALVNMVLLHTTNAYRLVVTGDITSSDKRELAIFQEHPKQLSGSIYHKTSGEQAREIFRQLNMLAQAVPQFKTPAVFTALFLENEIEGYEYAEVDKAIPDEPVDLLSEGQGDVTTVVAAGERESTGPIELSSHSVKRGPTLAPLSR